MKKILAFTFTILIGLMFLRWASSAEIILTAPISQTALSRVRVSNISDHPDRSQMSIRLSIGYTTASGSWVEIQDYHELVENIPAVLDDPKTPENEAKLAQPKYNDLQTLIKTSGKTAEEIILNRARTRFPGVIQ